MKILKLSILIRESKEGQRQEDSECKYLPLKTSAGSTLVAVFGSCTTVSGLASCWAATPTASSTHTNATFLMTVKKDTDIS